MNDKLARQLINVLEHLTDRLDEINSTLAELQRCADEQSAAVDNIVGLLETLTVSQAGRTFLNVMVKQ